MANPSNYSLIQTVNPAVSTGTITSTLANTQVGSLLLVFIGSSALTDTVSTVTDNALNTYIKAYGIATGTGGNTELWYCINANPTTSVVTTFSASVSTKSIFVREYAGMAETSTTKDQTVTASGSGTAVSTGASSATASPNQLVVCSCSCLGTNPTLAAGAGFGNFTSQTVVAAASTHGICDLTASSAATQTGLMTAGGTLPVWDTGLATFVISQGEAGTPYNHVIVGDGISRAEVAN